MTDETDYDVTEVSVSAGRKMQLDQYEPINTQVTVTAEVEDDADVEAVIDDLGETARDKAEEQVMRRHEEYVREEAFGDD